MSITYGKSEVKRENLDQLNQVIVQPLRKALKNNEHINALTNENEDNWEVSAAITGLNSLKDPNLDDSEVLEAFDRHLYTILNSGQTACNSNFLALAYSYTYLFQRINAIEKSFKLLQYITENSGENVLFIDVGCGVGALLIALRNLHENNDFILNYRGYDIVEEVLPVNKSFLDQIYTKNKVTINGNCIETFGKNKETDINCLIMVYSYIFSQNGVEDSINVFKNQIDSLFNEFEIKEFYIVYINIHPSYYNDNYKKLIKILENDGYKVTWKREESEALRNSRLNKLSSLEQNISSLPNSNVHCTVSEIRRG